VIAASRQDASGMKELSVRGPWRRGYVFIVRGRAFNKKRRSKG